jgi:acyl transferase domain-containing protein
MRQKALVICPGRGTYNKDELGYLRRYHADKDYFIQMLDDYRTQQGQEPVSVLDARGAYSLQDHTRGDNASALIYACAYADFLSIDRDKFDIVAVTGNSMGWYVALACAGVLSANGGIQVVNTMGSLMHAHALGGQVIYPFVEENWQEIDGRKAELIALTQQIDDLYISIELGGMLVFAGADAALDVLMKRLEPQDRFPLRLPNHGAFHTKMMEPMAEKGREALKEALFQNPAVPLIDGRGKIWTPYSTDATELYDYTLRHQVCNTYDFMRAVQVGVKEFAPDCLIVLGPGSTLGGAVAQSLLFMKWQGMESKGDFIARQNENPFVISMGVNEQRALV